MVDYAKTKKEFDDIVNRYENLVVVDFTATWCGPCQQIAPFYEEFASKNGDVVFLKVDVDENEETAEACDVRGMPTFQFYKGGEKVDEFTGASETKLVEYVERLKETPEETTDE